MAKKKTQTPAELYAARKQREEEEKLALMPPGLINQGNTCFMNSVLQGLIATRLLADLIYFRPLSPTVQTHTPLIASRRSPLLTNGTKLAGEHQQTYVDTMPIGDIFVNVMLKAWDAQREQRRENLTPRSLLGALGRKYDQYLDFAQQDAHEFMRILLDAMRMEEFDVIKKRQPPPPPAKKRRRRQPSEASEDEDKLISLSDMIFGGKLTSILVCQKCKHVSQTYEDFNDLSLSIKPEDYAKERKRDRLKNLARRFAAFPTPFPSSALNVDDHPHRSSSAPPGTPREIPQNAGLHEPPINDDPRRRSIDLLPDPTQNAVEPVQPVPEDATTSESAPAKSEESVVSSDKHLEFGDMPKPEREKKAEDGWGKLGRRLSLGMKGGKERKSRSRERRSSRDLTRTESSAATIVEPKPVLAAALSPPPPRSETPTIQVTGTPSPRLASLTPASSRPPSSTSTRITSITRSRSPKPPKPSRAESQYLRRILADVTSTSSASNPFALLNNAVGAGAGDSQSVWFKMGQFPGIEDCLKMFTAVEILDGENRVRCRQCWKIANGLYHPKVDHDDYSDNDTSPVVPPKDIDGGVSRDSFNIPTSLSTPELSDYTRSNAAASLASLPMTIAEETPKPKHISAPSPLQISPGGMPIPVISTTAPPTPEASPPPTARPNSLDSNSTDTHHSTHEPHGVSLSAESLLAAPPNSRPAFDDHDDESSSSEEEDDTSDSSTSHKPKKKPKPFILRPAYKRYLISTPPPVLVVHLKRFQQLSKTPMLSFSSGFKKLDDYVIFPEILDLTPFLVPKKEDFLGHKVIEEKCRYRLYAVVVHIGNMLGGHYVAYTALPQPDEEEEAVKTPTGKSKDRRQWAYISDTVVRLTTLEEVLKAKAYLCMYERI